MLILTLFLKKPNRASQGWPFPLHPPGNSIGRMTELEVAHKSLLSEAPPLLLNEPVNPSQTRCPFAVGGNPSRIRFARKAGVYSSLYMERISSELKKWVLPILWRMQAWPGYFELISSRSACETAPLGTQTATGPGVPSPQIEAQTLKHFLACSWKADQGAC